MIEFDKKFEEYTQAQFIDFLQRFTDVNERYPDLQGVKFEKYFDSLVDHFSKVTEHPASSDLIFYPEYPGADEPENIVKIVLEWRKSQGLPLFKDSL